MSQLPNIQEILDSHQNLRIYSVANAIKIASEMASSIHESFSDDDISEAVGSPLILRDTQGKYWTIDPLSLRWQRYDNEWINDQQPAGPLEGIADIQAWLCTTDNRNDFENDDKSGDLYTEEDPASPSNPQQALTEIVADTWQDYLAGLLTSTAADMLLKEYMIADKDAAFWTLGCRSGDWYRFNGKCWERSVEPPSNDAIAKPEEMEQLTDRIKHTILTILKSGASFLPELVAERWEPPALVRQPRIHKEKTVSGIPGLFCTNCNAELEEHLKFCTSCGEKVLAKPVTPACPKCGVAIGEGLKFCTNCGQELHRFDNGQAEGN